MTHKNEIGDGQAREPYEGERRDGQLYLLGEWWPIDTCPAKTPDQMAEWVSGGGEALIAAAFRGEGREDAIASEAGRWTAAGWEADEAEETLRQLAGMIWEEPSAARKQAERDIATADEAEWRTTARARAIFALRRGADMAATVAAARAGLAADSAEWLAVAPDAERAWRANDKARKAKVRAAEKERQAGETPVSERFLDQWAAKCGLDPAADYPAGTLPGLGSYRGQWIEYVGTHWRMMDDSEVETAVTRFLRQDAKGDVRRGEIADALKNIRALVALPSNIDLPARWDGKGWTPLQGMLYFSDGCLDLGKMLLADPRQGQIDFRKHSPADVNLSALPYPFTGSAKASCPFFLRIVSEIQPDPKARDLLQEMFGWVLCDKVSAAADMQTIAIWQGDGGNGKSVMLDALEALVGTENVVAKDFGTFGGRFGLDQLIGRRLCVSPEWGRLDERSLEALKAISGGDPISVERKFRDPFTIRLDARLLAITNEIPELSDKTRGTRRRMRILTFPVTIQQDQRIAKSEIRRRLDAERQGILVWALQGAVRLLQRGHWTETEDHKQALDEQRLAADSVAAFAESHYVRLGDGEGCTIEEIYLEYQKFCVRRGQKALAAPRFGQRLQGWARGAGVKIDITRPRNDAGQRYYAYTGIAPTFAGGLEDDGVDF